MPQSAEEKREYNRQYRAKNAESIKAYQSEWRAKNVNGIKSYQKQWKAKNVESVKAYQAEYHSEYRQRDEVQHAYWERNLKRNYRMTPDRFNALWHQQEGKCLICTVDMLPRGRKNRSVAVDHNHATGEIRGLLCRCCNRAIGLLQDSPEILRSAADYLQQKGNYFALKSKD